MEPRHGVFRSLGLRQHRYAFGNAIHGPLRNLGPLPSPDQRVGIQPRLATPAPAGEPWATSSRTFPSVRPTRMRTFSSRARSPATASNPLTKK